jgi:hypothetical protein
MVHEKSNGNGTRSDVGTGVLLHGLMNMLSEVLDGLDRRLGGIESSMGSLSGIGQLGELSDRLSALESRIAAQDRLADQRAALLEQRLDDLAGLEQAVHDGATRSEEAVQAAVGQRIAQLEATLAEGRAEAEAVSARLASHVAASLGEVRADARAAVEELAARVAVSGSVVEDSLRATADATEAILRDATDQLQSMLRAAAEESESRLALLPALSERVAHVAERADEHAATVATSISDLTVGLAVRLEDHEASLSARLGDQAASTTARLDQVEAAVDAVREAAELGMNALRDATEIGVAAARESTERVTTTVDELSVRLAALDAAVAAARAETAALPVGVAERVDDAVGRALSGWRNRLRRGEGDEGLRKLLEPVVEQLSRVEATLASLRTDTTETLRRELTPVGDQVGRVHEAVNRAQGESLRAAEATVEEVRRLVASLANPPLPPLPPLPPAHDDAPVLDAVAAVAERLVALHGDLNAATPELGRLRDAVLATHERADAIPAVVGDQFESSLRGAVTAITDRLGRERNGDDAIRRELAELTAQVTEVNAALTGTRRDMASATHGLPDLLRSMLREATDTQRPKLVADLKAILEPTLTRIEDLAGRPNQQAEAVESIRSAIAALADHDTTGPVLAAIEKAGQEQQEVLNALHSSLSKRFDARAKAMTETVEHLGTSLDSARKLGPVLERVGTRLDAQQPFLDQLRNQLLQLGATMAGVPSDIERRHAETTTALDRTTDALTALRRHAHELDKAVQAMKSSHESVAHAVTDLRDSTTGAAIPERLDDIAAGVVAGRKQVAEVVDLARSLGALVTQQGDQQSAGANRLAELVAQTRAAARSDLERLESTLHLEVLKQHQQDQGRLAQSVAGVSEVVEREANVLAQRVAALATEVDGLRLALAGRAPADD